MPRCLCAGVFLLINYVVIKWKYSEKVMKVIVTADSNATVEFENEDELRAEYENNISARGLSLATDVRLPEFTTIQLTLSLIGGGTITVPATIVRHFESAMAVSI